MLIVFRLKIDHCDRRLWTMRRLRVATLLRLIFLIINLLVFGAITWLLRRVNNFINIILFLFGSIAVFILLFLLSRLIWIFSFLPTILFRWIIFQIIFNLITDFLLSLPLYKGKGINLWLASWFSFETKITAKFCR